MKRTLDALEGRPFDLLVLGGGITGAGVALDSVLRQRRVALIDKGDFASGTSSISTKLVHGGLRYLEQGQLALVYEALHERRRLLNNAPHLVHPLRFVIPFYSGARVPAWKWRAGLMLYDLLAGRGNLQRSRARSLPALRREFPDLECGGLLGGAEYADAQMDDARLCIEVTHTAAREGAVVANYVEVVGFDPPGNVVRAVDHLTGRELRIAARVVVNATGPWADRVRALAGDEPGLANPMLAPTKGVHLIAPDRGLPAALLLLHPRDGRVFFVLPWLGKTLIGTTDTDCPEPPDEVAVTESDIDYLLEGYNHHFRAHLSRRDILGSFAGLRPLLRSAPGEPASRSREYKVVTGPTGLITVAGGKYTTYRLMAKVIANEVERRLGRPRPCVTRFRPLIGAPHGEWSIFEQDTVRALSRTGVLDERSARHLVNRYGRLAEVVARYAQRRPELARPVVEGEPDLLAEFAYQRDHEMAVRPEDFLLRRTRLGLFRPDLVGRLSGAVASSTP
jgi:glycerol-3-phosphate dehydrogenase